MRKGFLFAVIGTAFSIVLFFQLSCSEEGMNKPKTHDEMVALGKYIVHTSGCDDCHTPKMFTEKGPVFDTTKLLSGHQQGEPLPSLDLKALGQNTWAATTMGLTAWVGPWGISFASNITPDNATGIGTLSEEMFIKTMREGKYMGVGRPLLPPMPWEVYGKKTDEDLKAIYAYLMSIKPIRNEVPQPVPPDNAGAVLAKQ
ncbi:MAG: diheme cytochrome c-553 [Ignavibacteriaceae bacterium]|nr:diheme cytochrome c-553 [Ignavibacteriaceae bacterium]